MTKLPYQKMATKTRNLPPTKLRKQEAQADREVTATATAERLATPPVQPANGSGSPSNRDILCQLYTSMLKCRLAAERARRLRCDSQMTAGDLATRHEAVVAGASLDLESQDSLAVSSRDFAAHILWGSQIDNWLRRASFSNGGSGTCTALLQKGVPPAYLPADPFRLGTGIALAHKLERQRHVAVALCADVTSLDGWHETFRFAGVHKLPVIYVVKSDATGQALILRHSDIFEDVGLMARDYGFPGIIVDGHDAVAVWRVAYESIHRARQDSGPTLIECQMQPTNAQDPLAHLEHYMKKRALWDESWKRKLAKQLKSEIEEALAVG